MRKTEKNILFNNSKMKTYNLKITRVVPFDSSMISGIITGFARVSLRINVITKSRAYKLKVFMSKVSCFVLLAVELWPVASFLYE